MDKVKKHFVFSELIVSIIFSIAIFLMTKIKFFGMVYDNNYIDEIFLSDLKILILLIPITYLIIHFIFSNYKGISDKIISIEEKVNKKKFVIISFILIFIIYLIYYLSLYPGGIFIDTYTCFQMNVNEANFTSQHPVLFTLSVNFIKYFYNNQNIGFGIYTFIQMLVMVCILTYFIYWLLNKKVNSIVVSGILMLLLSFDLYPLYSISVWKDTYFSLSLFMFILAYIDLMFEIKSKNINKITILRICIFTALTMLLRSNGMVIPFISVLILILANIKSVYKKEIKNLVKFLIIFVLTCLFAIILQKILLLKFMNHKLDRILFLAIPNQQIARVVSVDGNISDEQKELIEKIIPIKNIKADYNALIVDKLESDPDFNWSYVREHFGEYFKLWFELLLQNPYEYIKAYLLQTSGFWTFNVVGEEAYVQATLPDILLHKLHNIDYISELTNGSFSFKENLLKYPYISGGVFFWITFFSAFLTLRINKKGYALAYLPALLLWATVMVSTPMGQALRYVFALVLMLPLNLVLPAILSKEEK